MCIVVELEKRQNPEKKNDRITGWRSHISFDNFMARLRKIACIDDSMFQNKFKSVYNHNIHV